MDYLALERVPPACRSDTFPHEPGRDYPILEAGLDLKNAIALLEVWSQNARP
jgi:hypothetical protein